MIWAAAFLTGVLCVIAPATWVGYRRARSKSGYGILIHPRVILTPFTNVKGISPLEFTELTKLPIYPGATSMESGLLAHSNRLLASGHAADLTYLRFSIDEPLSRVGKWYQDRLGPGFTRSEGALTAILGDAHSQMLEFVRDPQAPAVLIHREKVGVGDEVLMQPVSEGEGMVVTLIHYLR